MVEDRSRHDSLVIGLRVDRLGLRVNLCLWERIHGSFGQFFHVAIGCFPTPPVPVRKNLKPPVEEKVPDWYTDLPGVTRESGNMLYRDYVGSSSKE